MIGENPERRARSVALIGLVFQILLSTFYVLLFVWSESEAMRALAALSGIGSLIWVVLILVYHQRALVQEEIFETEQLRKEREGGLGGEAIFDAGDETLLLARRRLRWMYRWLLPTATVVLIGALVAGALVGWSWSLGRSLGEVDWPESQHSNVLIWFLGGSAFLSFLLSRYAVGMARQREWQLLRAGASYLMGVTLAAVALAATLAALHFLATARPEHVLAYVLRALLLVLAIEFGLNLVLDFYRPRAPDDAPRPAFDSRLLGLFTEPGGIARSIAEAINYQFGFEVSSTWFYKLLERSAVPLVGFALASLLLASSLVFIEADERAVVERFGRPLRVDAADAASKMRILEPGLHVTWPWPIDRIRKASVEGVHQVHVGKASGEEAHKDTEEMVLWTNKHEQEPHLQVLVATPKLAEFITRELTDQMLGQGEPEPGAADRARLTPAVTMIESGEAVSVSMLRVALVMQYRIRDSYQWLTTYRDPEGLLKAIASREITRSFASVEVSGVLGQRRGELERDLRTTIQAAADEADVGVDLVFLGLQGVHPLMDAAESFQDVIGAEQKKTAAIRSAWADYSKRLSAVAGDVVRAEQLEASITQMNRLDGDASASEEARQAARQRVQTLFFGEQEMGIRPVGGEAMSLVAGARSERWRLENEARSKAIAFEQEMATQEAAPGVYRARHYLAALADAVQGIRKYAIAAEGRASARTFHLDVKDPMNVPLDVALEEEQP